MPSYDIRLATPTDLPRLPELELAAATRFPEADLPAAWRSEATPLARFAAAQAEGRLWVACTPSGEAVGFALIEIVDAHAHLEEMDVHPLHGRRGLGSRLLATAAEWARSHGHRTLTLTTFAHLPWNAPFYAREGFRVLPAAEMGPELSRILREESARGLRHRVAMERVVGRPPPDVT